MNKIHDLREGNTTHLHQAADWVLRMEDPARTENDVNDWLRWCDSDTENLQAFEALQRDWRDLDALKGAFARAPATGSGKDVASVSGRAALRLRAMRFPAGIAACVALSITAVLLFQRQRSEPPPAPAQNLAAVETNRSATLPDGSKVILGTNTTINVDFTGLKRNLELSAGEAYFKVAHDRQHPFVVHAGAVSVTAVGTAFDVKSESTQVAITVEEGTVDVAINSPLNKGLPAIWHATAGSQVVYSKTRQTAMIASVDASAAPKWRSGELAYVWEPLGSVIEDLNRYSGRRIRIEPNVAKLRFTGTVFTASLSDWLAAIQQSYPVRVETSADGEIVLKER